MECIITLISDFLKRFIFSPLYESAAGNDETALDNNTRKHAKSLLNCLVIIPLAFVAVYWGGERASDIVFYVSIAAQISGLAWFVVSFAALPQRHLKAAMKVTESMFSSFLAGVFSLLVFAAITAPLSLFVVTPIYIWLYRAAVMYDSADLLKAGKDEQELLAAQATQRMEKVLSAISSKLGATKEGDSDPPA